MTEIVEKLTAMRGNQVTARRAAVARGDIGAVMATQEAIDAIDRAIADERLVAPKGAASPPVAGLY